MDARPLAIGPALLAALALLLALLAASARAEASGAGGGEFVEAQLVGGAEEDEGPIEVGTGFTTQPPGARGFNDRIEWVNSLADGLEKAKAEGRPALVLIHNTACGACGKLKNVFASSDDSDRIVELSRRFVMVNLQNEEEPKSDDYSPDGSYIPRLFFVSSAGRVQYHMKNREGTEGYDYFYFRGGDVVREMEAAADKLTVASGVAGEAAPAAPAADTKGPAAGGAAAGHDEL